MSLESVVWTHTDRTSVHHVAAVNTHNLKCGVVLPETHMNHMTRPTAPITVCSETTHMEHHQPPKTKHNDVQVTLQNIRPAGELMSKRTERKQLNINTRAMFIRNMCFVRTLSNSTTGSIEACFSIFSVTLLVESYYYYYY